MTQRPDHPRSADSAGKNTADSLAEFEQLAADLTTPVYLFRLFVSGTSSRSALAIANIRQFCEQYLKGSYTLEVVDVYQQPQQTRSAQIVVVPTLIKELPLPAQRFIGDMSNTDKIVRGLRLHHQAKSIG